jgi:hypothetical protein
VMLEPVDPNPNFFVWMRVKPETGYLAADAALAEDELVSAVRSWLNGLDPDDVMKAERNPMFEWTGSASAPCPAATSPRRPPSRMRDASFRSGSIRTSTPYRVSARDREHPVLLARFGRGRRFGAPGFTRATAPRKEPNRRHDDQARDWPELHGDEIHRERVTGSDRRRFGSDGGLAVVPHAPRVRQRLLTRKSLRRCHRPTGGAVRTERFYLDYRSSHAPQDQSRRPVRLEDGYEKRAPCA